MVSWRNSCSGSISYVASISVVCWLANCRPRQSQHCERVAVPVVDNSTEEPPPLLVAVHGPPGVGKTTLIRCLIKHYTRQSAGELRGPVTVVSSKKRRLTFIECPTDICGMLDVAKAADLVLLLIDGEFGFEMETFEFLMLLQQHGMPKVIGVLNHLDGFKDNKKLKKVKKELKTRFEVEVSHGSKLFYLSGIRHGKYLKREVLNLARFISTAKTRPINWRLSHPYLIADRFEVRCRLCHLLSSEPWNCNMVTELYFCNSCGKQVQAVAC